MTWQALRARAALVAAALAATGAVLSGCGDSPPQTGIIAEITSNLAVPGEIDSVQVTVTTASGAMPYQETFPLVGGTNRFELPLRVGIRPRGDAAADFRIEASGRLGQTRIVSRSATLHFVGGRILLLPLPLLAACANSTCIQPGFTCQNNGACTSDVVDPTTLPPYHPGTDAGPPPDARDGGGGGGAGTGGTGGRGGGGGASGSGGTGGSASGTGGSAGGASGTGGTGGTGGSAGGASGSGGGAGARGGAGGTGGGGTSGGGRGGTGGGGTGGGGISGGGGLGGAGGRGGTAGNDAGTGSDASDGGGDGPPVVTTLNNGLVSYWAFDQSSTSYPDYSGNGNTASATAGLWTAAGEVGGALDLTSATYFAVGTPGSASVNTITGAVSISAWIVPLAAGAVYTIMSRIINIGYWRLTLNTTGALSFGAGTRVVASPGMPGDGTKWVHVAASYDGTTARLYINGAQVAMATFGAIALNGGPVDGGPGGYGPDIGGRYDNINAYHVDIYNGQMDEIALYNRGLTAVEVDALARGALPMRR